jgi:sulfite reductase (NADPH) flavoprotein alpha-component
VSRWRLPTPREIWFQLHWFVGVTAGTLLAVIGLTGAIMAFEDELLDVLNPGIMTVGAEARPPLAPTQLLQAAQQARAGERVVSIVLEADPASTALVRFAAPPGERRGPDVRVHPYTGAVLPALRFEAAFNWVEELHRWLLLPRAPGRLVLGILALCLVGLALSGLYLRWPRKPASWRTWLTFNTSLRGRSFLWALHAIAGTWALVAYLIVGGTGIYWSFDVVRDTVQGWAGNERRAATETKAQPRKRAATPEGPTALDPAWNTFLSHAPNWASATIRLPERGSGAYQLTWIAQDGPHERARNRMSLRASDGALLKNEPYGAQTLGQRALTTIRPLHTGSYFGLPGRVIMMLASLALPGFAITGWLLYLGRRRQQRSLARERALAMTGEATTPVAGAPILLAFATQGGQAERIALHSAAALRAGGRLVDLRAVSALSPGELAGYDHALFVAATFGDGEAPDAARRFTRELHAGSLALAGCKYAVLALGDRNYARYCGYGIALDERLGALGATALFPRIDVDQGDPAALGRWIYALGELGAAAGTLPAANDDALTDWRLVARTLLNPGSLGAPLYEIVLQTTADQQWQAGDLLDVAARHTSATVDAWLAASHLDGDARVTWQGEPQMLREALAWSELPGAGHPFTSTQECADALKPLATRRYSIAGIPQDGALTLLVRQQRHEQGMGLASGWLTAHLDVGAMVRARLATNPGFHGPQDAQPCIYIGNGSGMAGLRAHLRSRALAGQHRNWLLFGERQRAFDSLCAGEIAAWRDAGALPECDLVFSRDDAPEYVQDRLRARADTLHEWVERDAVIHVCGSLQGMAGEVDAALASILGEAERDRLLDAGRYRRDVY